MIGLVLVAHGRLAYEFKAALEHVMGPQKQIGALTIGTDINLPMLVKLAKVRQQRSLPEAIDMAQQAGRKYVTIASNVLAAR